MDKRASVLTSLIHELNRADAQITAITDSMHRDMAEIRSFIDETRADSTTRAPSHIEPKRRASARKRPAPRSRR